MIVRPVNDRTCLNKLTELAAEGVRRDSVQQLASRFTTTQQLVKALRARPQREDMGDPQDGPKVACDVPQRARLDPPDPNCFERTLTYLAAAELIDSRPIRQMATVEIPGVGRHTFPLEDGRPVILDPLVSRNMLNAGLHLIRQAQGLQQEELSPEELIEWVAEVAQEEAQRYRNGATRALGMRDALDDLLDGEVLTRNGLRDLGWGLALAERAAPMFGQRGVEAVKLVQRALMRLQQRNFSLRFGKYKISPDWKLIKQVAGVGVQTAAKVAEVAAPTAAKVYLAKYGIPPQVVDKVFGELKKGNPKDLAGLVANPVLVKVMSEYPALAKDPIVMGQLASLARSK